MLGRSCLDPVPCFEPLVKVGQRKTGVRGGVQWAGGSRAGSTGREEAEGPQPQLGMMGRGS